jgi:hypothetical protein
MTFNITTTCLYAECHYAQCRDLFIGMLIVVMLSAVAPSKPSLMFVGKAQAYPSEAPFSLFLTFVKYGYKIFCNVGVNVLKLFTAVSYEFS